MTFFMVTLHRLWNARLSPILGLLANFWLFWLVLYRTPKEMQKHSRILLQTCVLDIIFLAITLIGVPIMLVSEELGFFLYEGLFFDQFYAAFGDFGVNLHENVFYGFLLFDIMAISVQFIYRYFLLNHNIHIGPGRYLILLLIPSVPVVIFCIFDFISIQETMQIRPENIDEQLRNLVNLNDVQFYFTADMTDLTLPLYMLCYITTYAVIIFCAVKMVKCVNAHSEFSENTKRLNRQLTRTLIILAFLPCCCIIFDCFCMFVLDHIKGMYYMQVINIEAYVLLPCLNPLVSIATNTPCRNAAMFWRKQKIKPLIIKTTNMQIRAKT